MDYKGRLPKTFNQVQRIGMTIVKRPGKIQAVGSVVIKMASNLNNPIVN